MNITHKGKRIVTANPLLDSLHTFNAPQLRLIFMAFAQLDWVTMGDGKKRQSTESCPIDPESGNRYVEIDFKMLDALFGTNGVAGSGYKAYIKALKEISNTTIDVDVISNQSFFDRHSDVFKRAIDYRRMVVTVRIFDSILSDKTGASRKAYVTFGHGISLFINHIKDNFTVLSVESLGKLRSVYGLRLYLLLKKKFNSFDGIFEISTEDAKEYMLGGLDPATAPKDFNMRVMVKALDEINKYTDLECKPCSGKKTYANTRGRAIVSYRFHVKNKSLKAPKVKFKSPLFTEHSEKMSKFELQLWAHNEMKEIKETMDMNKKIDPNFEFTEAQQKKIQYRMNILKDAYI